MRTVKEEGAGQNSELMDHGREMGWCILAMGKCYGFCSCMEREATEGV